MKKVLKVLGVGFVTLVLLAIITGWIANEPLPTVSATGAPADALAKKMELAVNKTAWDTTRYVNWTFRTGTSYQWDKAERKVIVTWGKYTVLLHTPSRTGTVLTDGVALSEGEEKTGILQKAWAQFANDSFWLCAPMKAFDGGTSRGIVKLEDGSEGLLVTYSSGGVTPGDQYLWILDDTGLPKAWKMWVSIIPVGGLQFEWTDWTPASGPRIAQDHPSSLFNVPIQQLSFPDVTSGAQVFSQF